MTCRTVPAPRYGRSRPPTIREAYAAGQDPAPAPRIHIEPGMPRIGRLSSGPPFRAGAPRSKLAQDAVHVTPYDENSMMHYPQCRTSMSGGYRQSKLHYQGAIGLYGLATAEIMNL
jgi:hypothetical protein